MPNLNIVIADLSGEKHNLRLLDNIEIERLLPNIIRLLELANDPSEYLLFYGTRVLEDTQTLDSAGITDGTELQLKHQASAALPPEHPPSKTRKDYYVAKAHAGYPAFIIYLLDISGSMGQSLGNKTRIQVVEAALKSALKTLVSRSLRGNIVSPRYKIAMFTYSDKVNDVYNGIKTIDEIIQIGIPNISATRTTNTFGAFTKARELLRKELPKLQRGISGSEDNTYPAPLVCHLTDGEYTKKYGDPEPIAKEIMSMSVPDGHVLIENIYISDTLVTSPIDIKTWSGFSSDTLFPENLYARKLLSMSSNAPSSYCALMNKREYGIVPGSVMLYPGISDGLVNLAFQMAISTPRDERS